MVKSIYPNIWLTFYSNIKNERSCTACQNRRHIQVHQKKSRRKVYRRIFLFRWKTTLIIEFEESFALVSIFSGHLSKWSNSRTDRFQLRPLHFDQSSRFYLSLVNIVQVDSSRETRIKSTRKTAVSRHVSRPLSQVERWSVVWVRTYRDFLFNR